MEFEAEFVEDMDVLLPQDLIAKWVSFEPLVEGRDWTYYPFEHAAVGVFFIGVDFGKHMDYSVVAAVEKKEDHLRLIHVYRFPLKTSYASVIGYVKALCDRWKTVHRVCADQKGVGVAGFGGCSFLSPMAAAKPCITSARCSCCFAPLNTVLSHVPMTIMIPS